MSIWRFLKNWRMGLRQQKKTYHYVLGNPPRLKLTKPAAQENRRRFSDSLAVSPPHDIKKDKLYQLWILLSPREQDVTALSCLKLTNKQIAIRLGLSKETVRSYLEKALIKLNVQSKADLRVTFANWDFSAWERRRSHR